MLRQVAKGAFARLEAGLRRKGYRITWAPPAFVEKAGTELPFELEFVIAHLMLTRPSPFFIQIGAAWEGILLEPLPDVFQALEAANGSNPRLRLINAALAESDGSQTIYSIRMDGEVFSKAHQFSSFRKEALLGQTQWVPDVAERIEERQIATICFPTLLKEAGGRAVDLLLTDTEGYDYTILKMIDFTVLRPSVIAYEHVHMSKAQQDECVRRLAAEGYRMTRGNLDTIAYRMPESFGFR